MAVEAAPAVPLPIPVNGVLIGPGHPFYKPFDATLKPSQGGPGMFMSRKDPKTGEYRLFAMPVPVTRVERDPVNEERTVDVPIKDDQGRTLYQLDPAARATIALANNGDENAASMPTTPYPDAKDAMASGLESLQKSLADQQAMANARLEALQTTMIEQAKASDARMEKLIAALVAKGGK